MGNILSGRDQNSWFKKVLSFITADKLMFLLVRGKNPGDSKVDVSRGGSANMCTARGFRSSSNLEKNAGHSTSLANPVILHSVQ